MNESQIFNRILVRQRRQAAAQYFAGHDFITNLASDYIIQRLVETGIKRNIALDIGCHTGGLGKKLLSNGVSKNIFYCDLSENMVRQADGIKLVADEECLPFANASFGLIVSSMSMHWINDLPGTLLQIRKCLNEEGVFIASMPGIETLKELRHCLMEAEIEITGGTAPHISPFVDLKTIGHLLGRAGFNRPVSDSEIIHIAYKDMHALLKDIRAAGEQSALIKRSNYLCKEVVALASEKYRNYYSDGDGGILATAEIITITGLAA